MMTLLTYISAWITCGYDYIKRMALRLRSLHLSLSRSNSISGHRSIDIQRSAQCLGWGCFHWSTHRFHDHKLHRQVSLPLLLSIFICKYIESRRGWVGLKHLAHLQSCELLWPFYIETSAAQWVQQSRQFFVLWVTALGASVMNVDNTGTSDPALLQGISALANLPMNSIFDGRLPPDPGMKWFNFEKIIWGKAWEWGVGSKILAQSSEIEEKFPSAHYT